RSHEVDHVRSFDGCGRIALEIEWNNKDPFFDRDLEHFQRLHADSAVSVGIIVTRGQSLHDGLHDVVRTFLERHGIDTIDDLAPFGYKPTDRQREAIRSQLDRKTFPDAAATVLVSDKFGEATTHWRKLEERIRRGVGNPCPLVLIGLPISVVVWS
ncbi:MAG: BglII/BstYI family type II restriction endonuclease, partial [Acetobacteraceae bacterium]